MIINTRINKLISDEELSAFLVSEDLKELVSSKINFSDTLALLRRYKKLPLNIKRLMLLQSHPDEEIKYLREKYALKFPVEKVVLCEGITEEILLPKFSKVYGYDFNKYGVHLISAGGKNQVAKLYCELKDELKLPVFILLDADAKPVSEIIKNILRQKDKIYLIKHGEFESDVNKEYIPYSKPQECGNHIFTNKVSIHYPKFNLSFIALNKTFEFKFLPLNKTKSSGLIPKITYLLT